MTTMIDKIWQADFQQQTFRQLLNAFSRPGSIVALPNAGGRDALGVLATLTDGETSLADPHDLLTDNDWLRLQLRPSKLEQAMYIICQGARPVDFEPRLGTLASPEYGATLIVLVDSVCAGNPRYRLSGPGIETFATLSLQGLDSGWIQQRSQWNSAFPMGVDMLLIANDGLVAVPRTTRITEEN
jgi:alpha-D-ribose 1-methylphosphonate 5-triphosphate synthase subunit PhnH